ncbi:MAG: hypothetical protein AB7I04_01660 [Pseudomonadales bacterium]
MKRIRHAMLSTLLLGACSHSWDDCGERYCLDVRPPQHAGGVGAAQGLDVMNDVIWIIGDADTGVARAFSLAAHGDLEPTGARIALTENGGNLVPHPTGLTSQSGVGTFLGNTVGGRGEILLVDWDMAAANGTLDGAVLNVVQDGEAREGSRPELVWTDNRWLLASADYGDDRNEVRLYDPDFLLSAADTTEANVLVARYPSPPYVQSLHYWAAEDVLILVRNRKSGEGWRLTCVDVTATWSSGALVVVDELEPGAPGELEGLHVVDGERVLMVTSSRSNNAYPGTLTRR